MLNDSKLVFENSIISKNKYQNVTFFSIVLNPAFVRSETSDDDFQKHKFTLLSLDPHTCYMTLAKCSKFILFWGLIVRHFLMCSCLSMDH